LYRAFGWEAPEFAHLPLIMKPVGNGKLSNVMVTRWDSLYFHWIGQLQHDVHQVTEKDFPGSCNQLLALLGWNDGTERIILRKN
jgi:glutamyl-tRNA synthetase